MREALEKEGRGDAVKVKTTRGTGEDTPGCGTGDTGQKGEAGMGDKRYQTPLVFR